MPLVSVTVASTVGPSRNCTVPVAVDGVTAAVNVICVPVTAGLALDVTAVVVVVFGFTVSVMGGDVMLM